MLGENKCILSDHDAEKSLNFSACGIHVEAPRFTIDNNTHANSPNTTPVTLSQTNYAAVMYSPIHDFTTDNSVYATSRNFIPAALGHANYAGSVYSPIHDFTTNNSIYAASGNFISANLSHVNYAGSVCAPINGFTTGNNVYATSGNFIPETLNQANYGGSVCSSINAFTTANNVYATSGNFIPATLNQANYGGSAYSSINAFTTVNNGCTSSRNFIPTTLNQANYGGSVYSSINAFTTANNGCTTSGNFNPATLNQANYAGGIYSYNSGLLGYGNYIDQQTKTLFELSEQLSMLTDQHFWLSKMSSDNTSACVHEFCSSDWATWIETFSEVVQQKITQISKLFEKQFKYVLKLIGDGTVTRRINKKRVFRTKVNLIFKNLDDAHPNELSFLNPIHAFNRTLNITKHGN